MIEAQIYKALGDPVRLQIITRLAAGSPYTIGELSKNLGISRQGARKQLQVLVSANLVHLSQKGRETEVVLDTDKLTIAKQFITNIEQQWDLRLQALKDFVENNPTKK
ncbi:ArsR/SmtB family transcription factor [Paraglaciecola arctica]|uniref:ArsR/SmtB family transcription factor n=1 Tax=Paraglaciecola arctica TaxID=1128911 RepID=UPI001C0657C1|nr:helix-turn-helix transcriptional regulator [Paraglaciecola arctica]MBU3003076.1 helix-turn-helix domain-containing protein [Paraglaciecola arctica]